MFKRMTQKDYDLTQNAEVGIQPGEITELNLAEIHQVSGGCPSDHTNTMAEPGQMWRGFLIGGL